MCNETSTTGIALIFNGCTFDENGAQILIDKIKSAEVYKVTSLSFSVKSHKEGQIEAIMLLLKRFHFLNKLCLKNVELGPEQIELLTNDIKLPNLKYLGIRMPIKKAECSRQCRCKDLLDKLSFGSSNLEEVRYIYNEFSSESHKKCFIHLLNSFNCKIKPFCDIPESILSNIDIDLSLVPDFLKIPNLILVNCDLVDSDLKYLMNADLIRNLESLQLDFNQITCSGAIAVSQIIQKCTKLTHLSLSCNMIGNDGAMAISGSLLPSKLQELNLEGNCFGDEAALALAKISCEMCDNFKLKLNNCRILGGTMNKLQELSHKVKIDDNNSILKLVSLSHPDSINRAIHCHGNMLTLNLSDRRFCDSATEALAQGILHCHFLRTVNLSNCDLKKINDLFRNIRFCSNLRILDLSRNRLECEGVESLAYHLKDIQLEILNLSDTSIGSQGAAGLARWLRIGKKLFKYKTDSADAKYEEFLQKHLNDHIERNGCDGKSYARQGHKWYGSLLDLDLSGNSICCEGAAALSTGLKYCYKLEVLSLQKNIIMQDGCEVLFKGLKGCTLLKNLKLDSNQLSNIGVSFWTLERSIHLQELSLNNNCIEELTDNEAQILLQGLGSCTNLKILYLKNNKIGLNGARALQQAMKSLTTLEEVRVGNVGRYSGYIMKGIKNSHKLKSLHIQDNIIDLGCFKLLAKSVKHDQLVHLKLCNTGIHKVLGAKLLSEGLKHCPKIQSLDLSRNNLDSCDLQILSVGITVCRDLMNLDLSTNNIDSDGIIQLAESLNYFTNLKSISHKSNKIGSDGAIALMKSIVNCIELEHLQFQCNSIGPDGAVAIAHWVSSTSKRRPDQNSTLLVLNLALNSIKRKGAVEIAKVLKFCKNLSFFSISGNNIDFKASDPLANGLKNCHKLHTLFLNNNNFGDEGVTLLGEGLKHCQKLKKLSLSFTGIRKERTVIDCIKYNRSLRYIYIEESLSYERAFEFVLPQCSVCTDDYGLVCMKNKR